MDRSFIVLGRLATLVTGQHGMALLTTVRNLRTGLVVEGLELGLGRVVTGDTGRHRPD